MAGIDQTIVAELREVLPKEQRASDARREVQKKLSALKKRVRSHMLAQKIDELTLDGVGTFTLEEEEKVTVSAKALKNYLTDAQYQDFAEQNKKRVKRFKFSR